MDLVSVVTPTLNRPEALARALESLMGQQLPATVKMEIVVVDNSADGSARQIVERSGSAARWVHEKETGVATARNRGVREASGRWIAFLDDDEAADPDWIGEFVEVARYTGADAVFGRVMAKADAGGHIGEFAAYFSRQISRASGADITDLVAYLGTNNSMFDRQRCFAGVVPFDVSLNSSGGEDSLLLKKLSLAGRRFAWAPRARVVEWVPKRRLTWAYVRKRKFLSGQIRVFVLHMLQPVNWVSIIFWMAIGLVQLVVGAAAMLVTKPFSTSKFQRASVIYYAGLGKILWMPRFRPSLYGAGLVS